MASTTIISATPITELAPGARQSLRATLNYFWGAFWFYILAVMITLAWDGNYHRTIVFDTPFSPPHVFGYSIAIVSALVSGRLAFTSRMRQWFGSEGVHLWRIPYAIPGALFILGAGYVLLGIGGALDLTWHGLFGLDETGWSTPHSMLGWALFMILLGFLAARLALADYQPLRAPGAFILLFAVLVFTPGLVMGPMFGNLSQAVVHTTSLTPLFLREPSLQHTFRIYLQWNITRTNPIFVPLVALWLGITLTFMQEVAARRWLYLLVILLGSLLFVTPLPIWCALVVTQLLPLMKVNRTWTWAISGVLVALSGIYTWGNAALTLPIVVASVVLMLAGNRVGERFAQAILHPMERRGYLVVLVGLFVPLCTGVIDLILRVNTP